MYPESPTLTEWRLAGARRLAVAGRPLPPAFDGSDAAIGALNREAPEKLAELRYAMAEVVLSRPEDFPEASVLNARKTVASAPSGAALGKGFEKVGYGLGDRAGDFLGEVVNQVREQYAPSGIAKAFGEGVQAVKNLTNPTPAPKPSGLGWGTVILLGIAAGFAASHLKQKAA